MYRYLFLGRFEVAVEYRHSATPFDRTGVDGIRSHHQVPNARFDLRTSCSAVRSFTDRVSWSPLLQEREQ